jgi:hypothetical protein
MKTTPNPTKTAAQLTEVEAALLSQMEKGFQLENNQLEGGLWEEGSGTPACVCKPQYRESAGRTRADMPCEEP